MIDINKLKNVNHIVTHADCADGMASALILHDVLPDAKVTFIQHNSPEQLNLIAEPGMLFCDIMPHQSRINEFVEAGSIVLDHHKHAEDLVRLFGKDGVFADEVLDPGVSGALLAYNNVWEPLQEQIAENSYWQGFYHSSYKELARLAGIRDTWQKHEGSWQTACEQETALRFWSYEKWIKTNINQWPDLFSVGEVIFKRDLEYANKLADKSYRFDSIRGTKVAVIPNLTSTGDAAEKLRGIVDLIVGFKYNIDHQNISIIYSTRTGTNFDCGKFCKHFGGGGHTKAAGFKIDVGENDLDPIASFKFLLQEYEELLWLNEMSTQELPNGSSGGLIAKHKKDNV